MRTIRPSVRAPALAAALLLYGATAPAAGSGTSAGPAWTVLERDIALERGEWVYWRVDYRLRNDGPTVLSVVPGEVTARVEGWVSNSRVPGHANPRRSELEATAGPEGISTAEVVDSADEVECCRERLVVQVGPDTDTVGAAVAEPDGGTEGEPLHLAPGATLRVQIRLEHEHLVYGTSAPLLGQRRLELRLGPVVLQDMLPLDGPRPVVAPPVNWPPEPPEPFLDDRIFLSAPGSLHLEAHVPGKGLYRYPDYRNVPAGARMRLSFWYLVEPGLEGYGQARLAQYRDLPGSWQALDEGAVTEDLNVAGRWVRVERIFDAALEATVLTLDFRLTGCDSDTPAGGVWIDEVHLEPVDGGNSVDP